MRKVLGVVCIVVSVLLIVKGHDVGNSVGSQLKRTFTGAPVDAALKLYGAGAGVGLLGLVLIFWKK